MSNKFKQTVTSLVKPTDNELLAAFSRLVQKHLFPHLELCTLEMGKVLYEPGDAMRYVYFPTDCIIALVYEMEDGASAEISVVGLEGILGIAAFMGGESTSSRAIVLHAGHCFRLQAQHLQHEFNNDSGARMILLRYTQSLIAQMGQTAVCNRHHTIDQQLCRWLLLSLDRLPSDSITMTQELIANMLGVRRESVTEAAGKLQHRGVIRYQRGRITIIDRPQLEELCCECYAVVKKVTNRLNPRKFVPEQLKIKHNINMSGEWNVSGEWRL
jgi:CRP-like cAMP-binding protein